MQLTGSNNRKYYNKSARYVAAQAYKSILCLQTPTDTISHKEAKITFQYIDQQATIVGCLSPLGIDVSSA